MPGSEQLWGKKESPDRKAANTPGNAKGEVTPKLPVSGQILGVLVRSLGISHPGLRSKTVQRYFSGRLKNRVKESSRHEIIAAISETLATSVFVSTPIQEDKGFSVSSWIAALLDWHAVNWDRFRAFLKPRMERVFPANLSLVWQSYLRLASIDLALRVAAYVRIAGASPEAMEFLDWACVSRRGKYLNSKRQAAEVSIFALVRSTGVSQNTVEAWLYDGARPSDDNLVRIVGAFTSNATPDECTGLLRDLRMLYWFSDMVETLGEFVGTDEVNEIVAHLHGYASLLYGIIDDRIDASVRQDVLDSLATLGAQSEFSEALLAALVPHEADSEWKKDLAAAGSNWSHRVLAINLSIHDTEVDDLIRQTEGRVLKNWEVNNPRAYAHYQRSMELQIQGKIHEAIAEVARQWN